MSNDIGNIWTCARPEFGSNEGILLIAVCVLYSLRLSSTAFRVLLAELLDDLGYLLPNANPDVYLRAAKHIDCFRVMNMYSIILMIFYALETIQ